MTLVTLRPYQAARDRAALTGLRVAPDQEQFSGQPAQVIAAAVPHLTLHVILKGGDPVGLFRLDDAFHENHDFAPQGSVGLRSVIVDRAHQGRGIGTTMIRALPAYLARNHPAAVTLLLTVNLRNTAARRIYLKGGFTDTGTLYLGGSAGPQHVLRMDLPEPGPMP